MTPSLERDDHVFGTQPEAQELNPQILSLLNQFWGRVERLTAKTLSPGERAIVDARLLRLEIAINGLEKDHKDFVYSSIMGSSASNEIANA